MDIHGYKVRMVNRLNQLYDLVGGWAYPSEKMMEFVSWDYDIPNWMEK